MATSAEGSSSVRMRSIYVSTPARESSSKVNGKGGDDWDWINSNKNISQATSTSNGIADVDDDTKDEKVGSAELTLELPESTHSLLFTEKTCSLPHYFSGKISCMGWCRYYIRISHLFVSHNTQLQY